MNLDQAQHKFLELLTQFGENGDGKSNFLKWIKETVDINWAEKQKLGEDVLREHKHSNVDTVLEHIQDDLREALPITATLPSENIVFPKEGQNSGCHMQNTIHVDGFLFDDDEVDRLCDSGEMSRNYCTQCGSHQVSPLTFISHSMTQIQLKYIFQHLLPNLHTKTILDVGSRTGAVLYAAYLYSGASAIYGVELNTDFCNLQNAMINKYNMQDRIQVVCDDICNQPNALQQADVIVMNNVFEFFIEPEVQTRVWVYLRSVLTKPGTLLVMIPSLTNSLHHLQTGIDEKGWLCEVDVSQQRKSAYQRLLFNTELESDEFDDIHLYCVL